MAVFAVVAFHEISIHHTHVAQRPATVTYPDFCASQIGSDSVIQVTSDPVDTQRAFPDASEARI